VFISTWQMRNGKLYLNLNAEVLKKFNADFAAQSSEWCSSKPYCKENYEKCVVNSIRAPAHYPDNA